jgi:rubrerythrin
MSGWKSPCTHCIAEDNDIDGAIKQHEIRIELLESMIKQHQERLSQLKNADREVFGNVAEYMNYLKAKEVVDRFNIKLEAKKTKQTDVSDKNKNIAFIVKYWNEYHKCWNAYHFGPLLTHNNRSYGINEINMLLENIGEDSESIMAYMIAEIMHCHRKHNESLIDEYFPNKYGLECPTCRIRTAGGKCPNCKAELIWDCSKVNFLDDVYMDDDIPAGMVTIVAAK